MKRYALFMVMVLLSGILLFGCRSIKEADSAELDLGEAIAAENTLTAEETSPAAEETLPPIQKNPPVLPNGHPGKIKNHEIKSPMLEPTTQAVGDEPELTEPTTVANDETPQYLPLE